MKALVTGANGFTGSHLVNLLASQGHSVVGLVRRTSNLDRLDGLDVQLVYGDITDAAVLKSAMAGVDVVFHIAACVDLGIVDAARMERVNVTGTRTVLGAIRAQTTPPKLIYCSTIGIYGDTAGQVIDETYQRTQQGFSSAYDETKFKAQQLVNQHVAEGYSAVSLMPGGIFGADDPHFGPVVKLFLKGRLPIWPGCDRITGIVHVDDLVQAMVLAVEKAPSGEHFIISAGELSIGEMFQILGDAAGVKAPADAPKPLVRAIGGILDPIGKAFSWNAPLNNELVHYIYDRCVRISGEKAMRDLGWQPRPVPEILTGIAKQLTSA
ncbi:NAD-dependent epimerase/dehydratase family protein [Leptothoe kymatousa]|uniref:NAD-dependent epimerase/dehydratase family protein n=1 Tax=Leptothoe kymatousa TAU-MAC 1615 TaxID=2364775 RepID=A0ABS5Y0Q8_9CYAN|nr:NAD-dependent epimerase/dehydratase family protein [Leptothoe kymatousa]MBT9311191.1 NAD-dependent epimerase/dehydratase family protein [Leptothoe kymatousa TAU-MAC 1615]